MAHHTNAGAMKRPSGLFCRRCSDMLPPLRVCTTTSREPQSARCLSPTVCAKSPLPAEPTAEGPLLATGFRRIFGGGAAAECCKARSGCKRGAAMARATSNDDGGDRIISIMVLPFDASRRRLDLRSASRRGGAKQYGTACL